jgi:hypothetical protein
VQNQTAEYTAWQALEQNCALTQNLEEALPVIPSDDTPEAKLEAKKLRELCARLFAEFVTKAEPEVMYQDGDTSYCYRKWLSRFDAFGRKVWDEDYPQPEMVWQVSTPDFMEALYAAHTGEEGFRPGIDLLDYLLIHGLLVADRYYDDNQAETVRYHDEIANISYLPCFEKLFELLEKARVGWETDRIFDELFQL